MGDLLTITFAFIFLCTLISFVFAATSDKEIRYQEEYRVGLSGAFIFMFMSWLVIYVANINPFIKPEFKKEPPSYYKK